MNSIEPASTASILLREARESMGMSALQVAEELYLTPSYITKIDEDRIHEIPKQAFVKGYLRAYARVVNLNGDEIVAMFERTDPNTKAPPSIRSVTEEPVGPVTFTGPVLQTGVIGLVGLILIIVGVWYYSEPEIEQPAAQQQTGGLDSNSAQNSMKGSRQELESRMSGSSADGTEIDRSVFADYGDAVPDTNEVSTDSESLQRLQGEDQSNMTVSDMRINDASNAVLESSIEESIKSSLEGSLDADLEADLVEGDRDQSFSSQLASSSQSQIQPESGKLVLVGRDTIDGTRFISVDAGGESELHFTFEDECWIEVEDADGEAIFGDLGRAGDDLTVSGKAPFEVLFGNAPAVTMNFNGERVNLSSRTTADNTAKVRVGES